MTDPAATQLDRSDSSPEMQRGTSRHVEDLSDAGPIGPPEIVTKLQWLMLLRVAMITLYLGSLLALQAKPSAENRGVEGVLLSIVVGTYALTIFYALLLPRLRKHLDAFAYAQLLIDLALIAIVVSVTGGSESLFLFMYSLTVLNASILLFRRGAVYLSAAATALIVFQVTRETMGWLTPAGPAGPLELRGIFLSGMTNVGAVFFVALLAGYLSEQLRDAGQRLRFASRNLEALRVLNEHIVNSIQSGLVSFTLDDHVLYFNPAAARITGVDPDQVLFHSVLDLFPGIAEHRDRKTEGDRWEQTFTRADKTTCRLGFSLSPLLDHSAVHRGWILSFQDLTHLRQMEAQIKRSERFAGIGKMAAGIAHEIRNPLASMSGSIEMLRASERLDDTQRRLMDIVLRETDRLNGLVTDFLKFARPAPPQLEDVELSALLNEIKEMFDHRIAEIVDVDVTLSLAIDRDLHLMADPAQLRQVIWNLVNNAAQALPEGGEIAIEARSRTESGRAGVVIKVIDSGVGIDPEVVERIFDPFFTTKHTGSGLGLSLVLRIVEEHGGQLFVESAVDVGTTFVLQFPHEQSSFVEDS